jgi:hypothetical protein
VGGEQTVWKDEFAEESPVPVKTTLRGGDGPASVCWVRSGGGGALCRLNPSEVGGGF